MKRKRRDPKPALLVRVLTEIGRGKITEAYISDKHSFVDGETNGRHIWINPAVAVCDTLIHESLHRLEPEWHENYIRRTTTYLLRRMSDAQIQQLYEEYQLIAKRRRKRGRSVRQRGQEQRAETQIRPDPPLRSGAGSEQDGARGADARGEQLPEGEGRSAIHHGSDQPPD